jgi:uncharacterized membrane protein required for colicin V production
MNFYIDRNHFSKCTKLFMCFFNSIHVCALMNSLIDNTIKLTSIKIYTFT